jgi:hypothetical protein
MQVPLKSGVLPNPPPSTLVQRLHSAPRARFVLVAHRIAGTVLRTDSVHPGVAQVRLDASRFVRIAEALS